MRMKPEIRLILGPDDDGRRLDRILRKACPEIPLSGLHRLLRTKGVLVDGKTRSGGYRCRQGEILEIRVRIRESAEEPAGPTAERGFPGKCAAPAPGRREETCAARDIEAARLLLARLTLLSTPDLLFLDKPMGMKAHDGPDSLDSLVRSCLAPGERASVSFVPGPLHRLDRNSSGIITFPRTIEGARRFSEAMRGRLVGKTYFAVLQGHFAGPEEWSDTLSRDGLSRRSESASAGQSGKSALTAVEPLASAGGLSFCRIRILTGRTHQIRAQGALHGHPLYGDAKYGGMRADIPYYLHAGILTFSIPLFDDMPSSVQAPLPRNFIDFLGKSFRLDEKAVYSLTGIQNRTD